MPTDDALAATVAPQPQPGAIEWPSPAKLWTWVRFPLAVFVCHRIAFLAFSFLALHADARLHRPMARPPPLPGLDMLCQWDCGIFSDIAKRGYERLSETAMFPLFPLLARGVHEVSGLSVERALTLVANAFGFFSLLFIYHVFLAFEEKRVARLAVLLMAFWPTAFFQAVGYADTMMISLSALAVLLALQGRLFSSGLALGLGMVARHVTGVMGLTLLAEHIRQRGFRPRALLLDWRVLGLVLPFAVAIPWLVYQHRAFGSPFAFVAAREAWGAEAYMSLAGHFAGPLHLKRVDLYLVYTWPLAVGALLLATRRRWWTLAAGAIPLMLVAWLINAAALGRYAMDVWPAYLPLAFWLAKKPSLEGPLLGVLGMSQGLFAYLFLHAYDIL
jgi:hypothetical protein